LFHGYLRYISGWQYSLLGRVVKEFAAGICGGAGGVFFRAAAFARWSAAGKTVAANAEKLYSAGKRKGIF
jgi:hypothetical protein